MNTLLAISFAITLTSISAFAQTPKAIFSAGTTAITSIDPTSYRGDVTYTSPTGRYSSSMEPVKELMFTDGEETVKAVEARIILSENSAIAKTSQEVQNLYDIEVSVQGTTSSEVTVHCEEEGPIFSSSSFAGSQVSLFGETYYPSGEENEILSQGNYTITFNQLKVIQEEDKIDVIRNAINIKGLEKEITIGHSRIEAFCN